jgi:hypothetical protein
MKPSLTPDPVRPRKESTMPRSSSTLHAALFSGVLALFVASGVSGQTAPVGAGSKTADQPPAPGRDLFQPMGAFDLTPDQERRLEKLREDPSAGAIQIYRVDLNVPKTADAININLVPGSTMMLATRSRSDRTANDFSWSGGDASGAKSAALVVKDSQVTGTIRDGEKLYRVRALGGGATAVVEVDQKKLPPEHPPAFDRKEKARPPGKPVAALARRPLAVQASRSSRPGPSPAPGAATADRRDGAGTGGGGGAMGVPGGPGEATGDACGTIDVLVAYTPAAETESGSIDGLIQLAVDETNTSYSKSGILPRLRLVRTARTGYVESGDMELDVARLAAPADGFLDEIPPLRDAAGADVVVLVTGSGNFCGIARDILADVEGAYAVVGQNCATGYYSFGHEVGHLQGARHNPEADDTATPFAYGHGFFSVANRKRTVMSYDCPVGCTRIDSWATPQVVVEGIPMGDALLRNDARVLNETACDVAAFRAAESSLGGTPQPAPTPAPQPPPQPAPHATPAVSTWSLLLLLGAAPFVLRRRSRA